jgi:hypothetical protein
VVVERADHPFVQAALMDTDRRVAEGKPVAPSFLLACVLWQDVKQGWEKRLNKASPFPALQEAIDEVFDQRIGDVSGRGKLAADMREIWVMQPRFDKRTGATPFGMVAQPRFRAGFDFMRLRADIGEVEEALASWWQEFQQADDARREDLMAQAREEQRQRQKSQVPAPARRAPKKAAAAEGGPAAPAAPGADTLDALRATAMPRPRSAAAVAASPPARRCRGRRRVSVAAASRLLAAATRAVASSVWAPTWGPGPGPGPGRAGHGPLPDTQLLACPRSTAARRWMPGPDYLNAVVALQTALAPLACCMRCRPSSGRPGASAPTAMRRARWIWICCSMATGRSPARS